MRKIINIAFLISLFLYFVVNYDVLHAQRLTLSGYITERGSGESLLNASVYDIAGKQGVASNNFGFYSLSLPVGTYTITYSYIGYITQEQHVRLIKDTVINIALVQQNNIKETIVTANREDFNLRSSRMSAIEVPLAQVKSITALFGETDVMKAIQLLPGVQSASDGNVGIYVRGGNFDQNMITLDGATLYNAEHLKGFVSAFNVDVLKNVLFYKGNFPSQYGGRLSSVVDVNINDGNNEKYNGSISIGLLSSKLHLEGPIVKNRTTFNVSVRKSYFNAIVEPVLKDIYDSKGTLTEYSNMNYYDVTAKVTHKLNDKNRLFATFYLGKDNVNSTPSNSSQQYSYSDGKGQSDNNSAYFTKNKWGNIVGGLRWNSVINNKLFVNSTFSYSSYNYKLANRANIDNKQYKANDMLAYSYYEKSEAKYNSGVSDYSFHSDFDYVPNSLNKIKIGVQVSSQRFSPVVDVFKHTVEQKLDNDNNLQTTEEMIDTTLGKRQNLLTFAFYEEDEVKIGEKLKVNAGIRFTVYAAKNKSYFYVEPRFSACYMLSDDFSVKASYSRMSQGLYLLSSSNLTMPSDLWVPTTNNIKPMQSHQVAAGLFYELKNVMDFSVEGYYKTMSNVLEYKEGTSYMTAQGSWEDLVASGKGLAYGVEFLAQKKVGRTTGWVSYTWSKAYRQFDRYGEQISGGDRFYANNDCRNNISLTLSHKLGRHWELSGTFVYHTGKRGILAKDVMYGGIIEDLIPYNDPISSYFYNRRWLSVTDNVDPLARFGTYSKFFTYSERNNYKLPDYHRLDLSINYTSFHERGRSIINLSIYNVYNRMNISNVYLGYKNNKTVLKGVCLFPFMPSISYTYSF